MVRNQMAGKRLPDLTNPAGAAQIQRGYEAVDGEGELLTGAAYVPPSKVGIIAHSTAFEIMMGWYAIRPIYNTYLK